MQPNRIVRSQIKGEGTLINGMSTDYLNNKNFSVLITNYVSDPKKYGNEFGTALELLADRLIKTYRFKLVNSDDAKQNMILLAMQKAGNFNPEKGKAFNFYTTIMLNCLRYLYRQEQNYELLKMRRFNSLHPNKLYPEQLRDMDEKEAGRYKRNKKKT